MQALVNTTLGLSDAWVGEVPCTVRLLTRGKAPGKRHEHRVRIQWLPGYLANTQAREVPCSSKYAHLDVPRADRPPKRSALHYRQLPSGKITSSSGDSRRTSTRTSTTMRREILMVAVQLPVPPPKLRCQLRRSVLVCAMCPFKQNFSNV